GSDLGVFAHAWYSHTLWLLGDDAEAVARADRAIALARRRGHFYSQTLSLAYAALSHQLRGDLESLRRCAEEVVALCERYRFAYYDDWARVLLGWALGQQGRPAEGVVFIERALDQLDAKRALARRPYYLSLLAATELLAGDRNQAA